MTNHVNGVKVIKVYQLWLVSMIYLCILILWISYIKDYVLDNGVKVTNKHSSWNCPKGMSIKFGRN